MNRFVLSIMLSLALGAASSQKVYFVYLQSDPVQPFFVKMNGTLYSSTGSGYLILSKLHDSTYTITVGFPQNLYPEQQFSVPVKAKDHGYLLKNFGDKGWGLFDLQTLAIINTETVQPVKKETVAEKETKASDSFTDILAKAADDPSLKEKPVQPKVEPKTAPVTVIEPLKEEPKKEEVKQPPPVQTEIVKKEEPKKEEEKVAVVPAPVEIVKKDEPKVTTPSTQAEIVKKEETKPVAVDTLAIVKKEEITKPDTKLPENKEEQKAPEVKMDESMKPSVEEIYKASVVTKRSESSTTEGFGLVFIDTYADGKKDTIRILIPNPKPLVMPVANVKKEEKKFLEIASDTLKVKEQPVVVKQEDKPVVNEQAAVPPADTTINIAKKQVVSEDAAIRPGPVIDHPKTDQPVAAPKTNCPAVADESDFYKVRKKMAAAESDDDMIAEARKFFKQKCYTVQQIRNLGALFLSDKGKYAFYDAAYGYASDPGNFASLESELKDPYFIKRFKAMLGN